MIVGPFSGEPGFELLYWLPYLRANGLSPEDVAITRGGAGVWYSCRVAADAYEAIGFAEYRRLFGQRYMVTKVQKSFGTNDVLDAAILAAVSGGDWDIRHPAEMYQRLHQAEDWPFAALPKPDKPEGIEGPYIAAAFYTSHQMPPNRGHEVAAMLKRIADRGNRIVLLRPKVSIDDHGTLTAPDHESIVTVEYGPEESLRVQSEVIAHAEALVCTYGGLSYLGALYGVPTKAFHTLQPDPIHSAREDQMVAQLGADYQRVRL